MAGALLLNATFEPLCVVSPRRAVVLVLKNKAEMIEAGVESFHSERRAVAIPSVIRLVNYVRVPYRNAVPLSRRAIFARDQSRCQYCDRAAENIDHVSPKSRGGRHAWDNVVAACRRCNARKEDRLLSECDLRLHRPPAAPKATMWVVAAMHTIDPTWYAYLELQTTA